MALHSAPVLPFIILTCVAVPVLLFAEFKAITGLRWIAKPVASMGMVATAISGGASESLYGRWVLGALLLGLLGDVLLIPRTRNSFLFGLVSFLFGHMAITLAFALRGLDGKRFAAALITMLFSGFFADRWLAPHLKGATIFAVRLYILGISFMVATASGTRTVHPWLALSGAVMFYISDLSVAREQFVTKSPFNRLWGLPLYYAAQLLFAVGASSPEAFEQLFSR